MACSASHLRLLRPFPLPSASKAVPTYKSVIFMGQSGRTPSGFAPLEAAVRGASEVRPGVIRRTAIDAPQPTQIADHSLDRVSPKSPFHSHIVQPSAQSGALGIEDISDWYIPASDEKKTTVYFGSGGDTRTFLSSPIPQNLLGDATELSKIVRNRLQSSVYLKDFRFEYRGLLLRAHIQPTVEGAMYILRRLPRELPSVNVLNLPRDVLSLLLDRRFGESGGLLLICGGPGNGKTTTASSVVIERVITHGSFCLAVEDPPEFILHGDHPASGGRMGKIIQVPADHGEFTDCLRDALRCYPSNMRGSMLLIGEIRDDHTAAQALRAAVNGQFVISTLHASDPIAALERMLSMASRDLRIDEARSLLAHSIRGVIQQKLENGILSVECLFSTRQSSPVASCVSCGQLRQLSTELEQQQVYISKGTLSDRMFPPPSQLNTPGQKK